MAFCEDTVLQMRNLYGQNVFYPLLFIGTTTFCFKYIRYNDAYLDTKLSILFFLAKCEKIERPTLSEILDTRECTDEIISEYVEYIDNEIVFEREHAVSKYDLNK